MHEIDFTHCPRVPGLAYNGANGKKLAVSFEGAVWLLKFPPSAKDRPNDLCGSALLPQADESVEAAVVEVCDSWSYNWFDVK